MSKKGFLVLLALLMVSGLLVAGCAQDSDDTGAIVDQVIFTTLDSPAAAVLQLQSGDIDIYGFTITDPDLFDTIASDPELEYGVSYGGYRELRFNTWGPEFDNGNLNPFYVHEIREAMNWAINRHYMVEEHLGGLGVAKWTFMGKAFPDSAIRYPDIVADIEDHYAYDFDKAKEVVDYHMVNTLGAELNDDGVWEYNGEEVEIKGLIRADLPPYPEAGHYFADVLEDLGFKVDRMVRPGSEANPIWTGDHPSVGSWGFYTGGWSSPVIPRCSAHTFEQFYTHRVMPWPVFTVLETALADFPDLDDASKKLYQKDFTSMEERGDLFEIALWDAMKLSNQIWVCDTSGVDPFRADVAIAIDLAGGIGDPAWVYTAHRHDDGNPVAGTLRFGIPNLMVDPYNPLDGSAFSYDMLVNRRALGDMGTVPDPRDGLYWPQRIESAEVYMQTGLPVGITHDWLTLKFEDEIVVPPDAWADWDAEKQQFITTAERFPEGTTALMKSVVYYPEDIYDFPLHDGSKFSLADIILALIVQFERADENSDIFDSSKVGRHQAWLQTFKGMKILSEDPLVIETYSDMWYIDAEVNVNVTTWWPAYGTYNWGGFWHMITVGLLADGTKELAMTNAKADELSVEWMDYTKGPSLPILEKHMNWAAEEGYIPYEPTLGAYISEDEAAERWSNLQDFYEEWSHFWVGAGPYILSEVHAVENIIVLVGNENYPDKFNRWFGFLEPLVE